VTRKVEEAAIYCAALACTLVIWLIGTFMDPDRQP
jgi:hypothetical protein